MSSADNDDGVTAEDGRPTAVEPVLTLEDGALPGKLVLGGLLTSNYPRVDLATPWKVRPSTTTGFLLKNFDLLEHVFVLI